MPRSLVPEGIVALTSDPTGVRAGQTYYNTTTKALRTFDGTAWANSVPAGAASGSSFDGVDLNSATEVTLTSTTHPLRIGPASGKNLAVDRDTIQGRNNGAAAPVEIQPLGGSTTIGQVRITDQSIDGLGASLLINTNSVDATLIGGGVFISQSGFVSTALVSASEQPTIAQHLTRKDYVDRNNNDQDVMTIMGAF
jgi:hypothetical protein